VSRRFIAKVTAVFLALLVLGGASLAQDNHLYPPYQESILRNLGISNVGLYSYLPFDEWMTQAPVPPVETVAERKGVFYRAWATFWMNTLPAEGAWKHPIICPGSRFFYGIWLWDSGFHVLGLQYGGPKARQLALWQLEIVLNGQHDSGKLPRETWKSGAQFFGEGVQAPGILTLAANRLYAAAATPAERAEMRASLEQFYPRLARNHEWFFQRLDAGRGLCGWTGPDSGWDSSPRWDSPGAKEALDLNCFLYLDRLQLAVMARTLGKATEAETWDQRAAVLRDLIRNHLWNSNLGIYNDTKPDGNPSALITPVIFWPLWTGVSTPEQARGVLPFLKDPKGLATPWPLPSVAVNSPTYRSGEFWRGGTWINLNWVAIRGLQRYGFADEAKSLRERTLELIALTPVLYELYDSQSGAPVGSPHYGWTSALYIDLVMRPEVDSLRNRTE
jgi:putative isomerase